MPGDLTNTERDALSASELGGAELVVDGRRYFLGAYVAAGRKGVVWRGTAANSAARAIKFASGADYLDKSVVAELYRAASLEQYPCFARLESVERKTVGGVDVAVLVSEWVEGPSLQEILERRQELVSADLVRSYVDSISDALGALRANSLCHDDMNLGNVIAAQAPDGIKDRGRTFKVIDLGSLKPVGAFNPNSKREIDDYRWVAMHLSAMHNVALRRVDLSPRERLFFEKIVRIVELLVETDPTKRLADPETLHQQVEEAWQQTLSTGSPTVRTPFDYISADQIANDQILLQLFADSLPWLSMVNSPTSQLVTGPRGCGKSTVFRWLALRTHLGADNSIDRDAPIIGGFYLSAGIELQSRVGWIKSAELAQARSTEILHLFNLVVMREVLKTLALVQEHPAAAQRIDVSEAASRQILDFVSQKVVFEEPELFQGISLLRQASRLVNLHIFESHQRLIRNESAPGNVTSAPTLHEFSELLVDLVPYFETHPIVYLIDDYSTHRVPEAVQAVLHHVVWLRSPAYSFKLSAEKNGVYIASPGGRTAELAREYIEVDCGAIMLEQAPSVLQQFATQLLDARLTACDYKSDALALLGDSEWNTADSPEAEAQDDAQKITLGEALRAYAEDPKGQKPAFYFGVQCIADLCTGDVAALLLIYEKIFRRGRVGKSTRKQVPRGVQHEAIVGVSRQLLTQLRDYYGTGTQLHAFAEQFGLLVRGALLNLPLQAGGAGGRAVPVEMPRIEVDGQAAAMHAIDADPEARRIFDELLRRAVLIQLDPGSARHGGPAGSTSLRLHLRRIFLPAFGAALRKNRPLTMKPDEFVFALRSPGEAFEMTLTRIEGGSAKRRSKPVKAADGQLALTPAEEVS